MKMRKRLIYKKQVYIFVFLIALILLHKEIIIMFTNISTIMKKDNRVNLINNTYKSRVDELTKTLADYEKVYNNLKLYDKSSYVISRTSFRDIYKFYDYVYINNEELVHKNNPVINEDGLVGIILETDKNTSKVGLLTGLSNISVKVASSYGLIESYDKRSKMLIVRNINNYENISEGDEVITSGLADLIYGLKVGRVSKIENKGIEKIVYVKPYADFDNLNYLYVVV